MAAGLSICGVVGTISDVLEPFGDYAAVCFGGSFFLVLLSVYFRGSTNDRMVKATAGALAAAFSISFLSFGGLLIWQAYHKDAADRGIIGANSEWVRGMQDRLGTVISEIRGIKAGIDRVEQGVTRVEEGVGRVEERTTAIDARTQGIDEKVTALQQGSDPQVVARQAIDAAGFPFDDAGFIKALAQGRSELVENYKTLQIAGDETALRQALLKYPVDSTEFLQLRMFMDQAHSEHYAARPRAQIKTLLQDVRASGSVDMLRTAACNPRKGVFIDQFVTLNLGSSCSDKSGWIDRSIQFATKAGGMSDADGYAWWMTWAKHQLVDKPVSATIRSISPDQLIAATQGRENFANEKVQADTIVAFTEIQGNQAMVDLFARGTPFPTGALVIDDASSIRKHPCWNKVTAPAWDMDAQTKQRKPRCTARVTVHQDGLGTVRLIALDKVQPIASLQ